MTTNNKKKFLPFASSNGGPVIVIPSNVVKNWGLNPENIVGGYGSHPDYDKACESEDNQYSPYGGIGWVEVAGKTALVLNAEITTQFIQTNKNTGIFYRQGITDITAQDILNKIAKISEEDWKAYPQEIDLTSGKFFAFDSAYTGEELFTGYFNDAQAMECEINPGVYSIFWCTDSNEIDYIKLSLK